MDIDFTKQAYFSALDYIKRTPEITYQVLVISLVDGEAYEVEEARAGAKKALKMDEKDIDETDIEKPGALPNTGSSASAFPVAGVFTSPEGLTYILNKGK